MIIHQIQSALAAFSPKVDSSIHLPTKQKVESFIATKVCLVSGTKFHFYNNSLLWTSSETLEWLDTSFFDIHCISHWVYCEDFQSDGPNLGLHGTVRGGYPPDLIVK